MKIRRDAVAVSSVLLTFALLWLVPHMLDIALATYQTRYRDITNYPDPAIPLDQVVIPNHVAPLGITSLALIGIALIVTWAGYIKGVRWTWFIMFVIVWVWAFPVLMLPFFYTWRSELLIPQMLEIALAEAISHNGVSRVFVEVVSVFLVMVVALVLPVKTFIQGRGVAPGGPGARVRQPTDT